MLRLASPSLCPGGMPERIVEIFGKTYGPLAAGNRPAVTLGSHFEDRQPRLQIRPQFLLGREHFPAQRCRQSLQQFGE